MADEAAKGRSKRTSAQQAHLGTRSREEAHAGRQHSLLLREPDTVSQILVTAEPGTDSEQLAAAVADILPGEVEAVTGEAITDERLARFVRREAERRSSRVLQAI